MKKARTGLITPQPRFVSTESLIRQLNLFSVPFSKELVDSIKAFTKTSSLYSFIDSLVYIVGKGQSTLGLISIKYLVTKDTSLIIPLLNNLYADVSSPTTFFLESLSQVKTQTNLSYYLTNYLGLPDYNINTFYKDPFTLIDFVTQVDSSLTPLLLEYQNKDLFLFFTSLVDLHSTILLTEYTTKHRQLIENIRKEFYDYVLGASLDLSQED
jgi:hypothetical protein